MAKFIFYTVYILLFVAGGFITLFGLFPFRPVYASLLALLLIPLYGIPLDRVTKLFALFTLVIVISGIMNRSSLTQILMFLRFVITPYAMYYLVRTFINHKNINKIMSLSITLGMIQLPVVLIQRLFHDQIFRYAAIFIGPIDSYFGTFYIKDDPALSIFLMGLIIFLLFDKGNNYFVKSRYLKAAWFTITVLLTNSIISHLIVIGIWGYLFLRQFSVRTMIRVSFAGIIVASVMYFTGYHQTWQELVRPSIQQLALKGSASDETFFRGGYSRTAAVFYYLNEPLKWFGDGPSRYYNPVTRRYELGNTGQIFGFYAEIGVIGLAMGYWVLLAMARKERRSSKQVALPLFVCMSLLTITTSVMSDASIMLAYNLFLSTSLLSRSNSFSVNRPKLDKDR